MTNEKTFSPIPGALMLFLLLSALGLCVFGIVDAGRTLKVGDQSAIPQLIGCIVAVGVLMTCLCHFFIVQPNGSKVLLLFGTYKGTVKKNGFFCFTLWSMKGDARWASSCQAICLRKQLNAP